MRSEEGPGGAGGGGGPDFLTSFYRSSRCMGVGVWVYIILLYVKCHVIYSVTLWSCEYSFAKSI